ncbi:hypothetical protein N7493_010981 [Penicillium malachiteum]|uniref:Transcriptional regulator n=1 Tax=Penicillium malachiteum TaxID=1324776 RepID=A0AAD6HBI4_9EURO|nr:hypothetical protein N7493_010981 [Penicillium malachiteum]
MAPKYKIPDSDLESELEPDTVSVPSDQKLEKGLRDEVAGIFKMGNMEELTVKRVRLATEKKLGLTEGYFKQTEDWKARSEEIIKSEVEVQENANQSDAASTEKSPSPPPQPKKAAPPKRSKGTSAPKPRKRQKTQTPEDEEPELDSDASEAVTQLKKRRTSSVSEKPTTTEETMEDADAQDGADTAEPMEIIKEDSESEMSVVLDEEPKPKPVRKRKSTEAPKKEKKQPASKPKPKDQDQDPDQAEIKRLQGWLVKCGIRKMWFRELAPYDTAKAKIKHLKGMLEDAGMTGRYSQEKANKIRVERELKADLEQIQQGAKDWGTGSGDEGEGPPPRRAARGRQALAFLDSDGEETD